ncbi:sulfite exporter TauE/SafE family protein 2-like isoform X2 [Nymphaea colorata]|uniref:sulfite exporter TauE/SafE family protein 2-like isoform X2 n=1 Tax=Nymphaea colorata TaxID=210225 RepID=UPI00129E1038|nr:sulfite exporter TauE/SafE family protein 2-like isoform X2 [Nymphaea colorata]
MGELRECSFRPLANHVSGMIHHYTAAKRLPQMNLESGLILAGLLSFFASSISSAGGLGGGGLYIPILNLVAGLDMKTSASISALMVTGSTVANVIYHLPAKHPNFSNKPLIDYDITLMTEPCLLLGVSVGVICNVMFPEWLITMLFAFFLSFSTFTTWKAGFRRWKQETEQGCRLENKEVGEVASLVVPILNVESHRGSVLPWRKLGILAAIWMSFFVLQILRGDLQGQSLIHLKPCGVGYWLLFGCQVPLAILFTVYILLMEKITVDHHSFGQTLGSVQGRAKLLFLLIAVASGSLSGLFGIAGGMIISPILLQMGIPPHIAAATTSFMVSFSASMSAVQYLLLGLKHLDYALCFSTLCFISSWIGLVVIQKPIKRYGRASLIVFLVATIMAISTVLITSFGALNVWRESSQGKHMGFKLPC